MNSATKKIIIHVFRSKYVHISGSVTQEYNARSCPVLVHAAKHSAKVNVTIHIPSMRVFTVPHSPELTV